MRAYLILLDSARVGLEPTTLRVTAECSNQLSYTSINRIFTYFCLYEIPQKCQGSISDLCVNSISLLWHNKKNSLTASSYSNSQFKHFPFKSLSIFIPLNYKEFYLYWNNKELNLQNNIFYPFASYKWCLR